MIIEPFAGPGGWDEALVGHGRSALGIEHDLAACQTRAAAGHLTVRADASTFALDHLAGRVEGLIASPPCTDWSQSGKRQGLDGDTGALVLEVDRWVRSLMPRWIACEQVPPALGWWRRFAVDFASLGYSTWCGVLNAADYGVPQTRKRALLLASLDRRVAPPAPTHAETPESTLLDTDLEPWVSMGRALGWGPFRMGFPRLDDRGDSPDGYRERDWRSSSEPSFTVTEKARSWWIDPRVWPPGHKVNADDERRLGVEEARARYGDRAGSKAIRVSLDDALVLQGFRPDYPLAGTRTKRFEQIGNAIPPPLGWHALGQVLP